MGQCHFSLQSGQSAEREQSEVGVRTTLIRQLRKCSIATAIARLGARVCFAFADSRRRVLLLLRYSTAAQSDTSLLSG